MRTLHYQIYNSGNVGMCNILMSIENALIIAKLTNREKIIFYFDSYIPNSGGKTIFDLFDISYHYEIRMNNNKGLDSYTVLENDFHGSLLYYKEYPSKSFINGRDRLLDLSIYDNIDHIRTKDNKTLSFYSYLFYLGSKRTEIVEWVKESIKPKRKYINVANEVKKNKWLENNFNSVHIRRGDYLHTTNKNKDYSVEKFISKIESNFDKNTTLLVHTDEKDRSFFKTLEIDAGYGQSLLYIDDIISNTFRDFSSVEVGLVSLLIASESNNFVGTMMSTFTSFIQRYRLYNGKNEEFKFLYPQNDKLLLDHLGRVKREAFSEFSWNHLHGSELQPISFWYREWEGCYPQPNQQTSIQITPNFLTSSEIDFIIERSKSKNEFFERENRNRVVLSCKEHETIRKVFVRACKSIRYFPTMEEVSNTVLQVFVQYTGGETFWHMDSLAPTDKNEVRSRSILFYLNDDFTGSELAFPYVGVKFQPKRGTMVTYPLLNEYLEMNRETSHSASIITSGTKVMCYFDIKRK